MAEILSATANGRGDMFVEVGDHVTYCRVDELHDKHSVLIVDDPRDRVRRRSQRWQLCSDFIYAASISVSGQHPLVADASAVGHFLMTIAGIFIALTATSMRVKRSPSKLLE
ncbi:hypothetical protein PQR05_32325 [Paraburkholderia sediminicola]|uniref:hypothetical protein n=1 Tax=Paraburkholderia sediminicola TaxID=458836 RepID=UPI0038BDDD9D